MDNDTVVLELHLERQISPEWRNRQTWELDLRSEVLAIAKTAGKADNGTIDKIQRLFAASKRGTRGQALKE